MMTCNGCKVSSETDPSEDKGILEKIRRLKYEEVEKVHVGVCVMTREGTECRHITTIRRMLQEEGIPTVDGTHFTSKRQQSQ
jgi:predicted metal-binding protein